MMMADDEKPDMMSADPDDLAIEIVDETEPRDRQADAAEPKADAPNDELVRARAELTAERSARATAERMGRASQLQATAQVAVIQRDAAAGMLDSVTAKIASAIDAKKVARTEGNGAAEVDAEVRLDELRRMRDQLTDTLSSLPDENTIRANHDQELRRLSQPAPVQGPQARGDLASQWLDANSWAKEANTPAGAMLSEVSRQIHAEGLTPTDPAHFTELTRRMSALYPRVPVKGLPGSKATQRSEGPPVAGTRTSADPRTGSKNTVQLSRTDLEWMKKFKLDPRDKAVQKAYATSKFEDEQWRNSQGRR